MKLLRGTALFCAWLALVASHGAETTNTPPPVRLIGPGIFEVGAVRLDSLKREISFPAQVNMREGQIEYVVVSALGKLHESIFKSEGEPFHIHTAALLLNGRANTNPLPVEVRIEIEGRSHTIAEVVRNTEKNAPMDQKSWRYRGSRISEGVFLAQRDGSIISLIEDPDALVDNPGPDREKDEIWEPIPAPLPPIGHPVRIHLKFPEQKKE